MSITARPRLYLPIRDERGDLLLYSRIRVYQEDGTTLFTGKLYRDGLSQQVYSNPFVAAPALVSVYLAAPARVRLGIQADTTVDEVLTNAIDVTFDADQSVTTTAPLYVSGAWSVGALLCGTDASHAFWKPLRVDHEHETVAPRSVLVGASSLRLRQAGSFTDTVTVGSDSGGWGAASSLKNAVAIGSMVDAYGRGGVAIGREANATEQHDSPWSSASVALGRTSDATAGAVAVGTAAVAGIKGTAIGAAARATSSQGVALGTGARPGLDGIAIGTGAGSQSSGMQGSTGLGAGAQYGLPSSTDPGDTATLLGAFDPTRARVFPWANPYGSQSESPFDEYAPTMSFTGRTVQLQRGLEWLADVAAVQVQGDATLGGPDSRLGFLGAVPQAKPSLSDDEPSSGNAALDNLIFALRDLGLLRYRTEASMLYRADDMRGQYLDADRVTSWPERFGSDVATAVPGQPPSYRASDPSFNGQPTVRFDNSVYRRSTRPIAELRGSKLLPNEKHYIVVANHEGDQFGLNESLLSLSYLSGVVADEDQVLTGEYGTGRWRPENLARLEVDGLNQTSNRSAGLPGAHVYAATNPGTWPHARPVIGGPRDNSSGWDRWSGNVAELVGMDATWEPQHVRSMAAGLAFKYSINQPDSALRQPSRDFLITQHDPMNGTLVFFTKDYSDSYVGKVQGRATRVPKPVIFVPFISIYIAFSIWSFRGSLLGNWGNLAIGVASVYEVAVTVKIGDLDEDGDLDVDVDVDVERETYVGIFALNNNFTWSMGQLSSRFGYKICRIRHRVTKVVTCISGDPPFRYQDTDVNVYTTKSDGTLRLESTTPLWGDGTFKTWTKNPGKKVARVVERSTGNTMGTTEYQEKALPRTSLYASDDPEVSFANRDKAWTYESALTALAILEMPVQYQYRARHILSTLQLVCNDDGSLNESYSAVLPAKAARPPGESPGRWGAVWTILAVLRYQQVSGDGQFLPFARKLADFLGSQTLSSTRDLAASYFVFRDLAAVTGVSSYATLAGTVRTLMLSRWIASGRFPETDTSDAESLWADVMGGMFLLAIGDRAKARLLVRQLKRYRVKNVSVSAPHFTGPTGLIGYKPFADLGSLSPHLAPPPIIDQAGTWAAILFKLRYGEPAGDDVAALYRWQQTTISSDPTHDLYAAQFLRYSANATTAPYSLRTRPHLAAAGWGHLLSAGARALFLPDPLQAPAVTGQTLTISYDYTSARYILRFTWLLDPTVPAAAFEAIVEQSTNAGSSWSAVPSGAISGTLAAAADLTVAANGYSGTWTTVRPDNAATLFRVRIRARNAAFGAWTTTGSVALPTP